MMNVEMSRNENKIWGLQIANCRNSLFFSYVWQNFVERLHLSDIQSMKNHLPYFFSHKIKLGDYPILRQTCSHSMLHNRLLMSWSAPSFPSSPFQIIFICHIQNTRTHEHCHWPFTSFLWNENFDSSACINEFLLLPSSRDHRHVAQQNNFALLEQNRIHLYIRNVVA